MDFKNLINEYKNADKETKALAVALTICVPVGFCIMWVVGAMAGRA